MVVIKAYPDGFVVREARPEDKQEVLTSFDVYNGLDYVAHMYDHYMEHPKFFSYVGVYEGRIVSIQYLNRQYM